MSCCYIYQLPSWVLDDLCRNMDTLSEWDWMQFGEWGAREGGRESVRLGFEPRTGWTGRRGAQACLARWKRVPCPSRRLDRLVPLGDSRLGGQEESPHSAPQVPPKIGGGFQIPKGPPGLFAQPVMYLPDMWPDPQHPMIPLKNWGTFSAPGPSQIGGRLPDPKGVIWAMARLQGVCLACGPTLSTPHGSPKI